jgi:hypothetical protein
MMGRAGGLPGPSSPGNWCHSLRFSSEASPKPSGSEWGVRHLDRAARGRVTSWGCAPMT